MASLVQLDADMLPEIHNLVVTGISAQMPLEDTRRVFFGHPWTRDGLRGYGLADGGKLVGVLGLIFCEREFKGQVVPFCNLHTWHVQPDYRARSLTMLKPVINLQGFVITDFTAGHNVVAISRRLGFEIIDRAAWVLPLLSGDFPSNADLLDITAANQQALADLSPVEWQLYRDHEPFGCGFLLIRDERDFGTIIYSRARNGEKSWCQVHHVSAPKLLARHHAAARAHLLRQTGERSVAIDARLLGDTRIPRSRRAPATTKLARANTALAVPVDALYSEVILMKHPTLLTLVGLRQHLRAYADLYVPQSVMRMLGKA